MKRESCVIAGFFFLVACSTKLNRAGQNEKLDFIIPDSVELFMKLKMKFVMAHGWGYCYKSSILNVVKGVVKDSVIWLTVSEKDCTEDMEGKIGSKKDGQIIKYVGFRRIQNENPYVTQSGFMDSEKTTWQLIFKK
jgi:hypothetical protein